jgi:tetratricopeptide (TPR) repeat protein
LGLYNRWALALRNRYAYVACIQVAQEGLEQFQPDSSEPQRIAVAKLLMSVSDGLGPMGRISERTATLDAALGILVEAVSPEARFTRASINLRKGRDLYQQGNIQGAESVLQAALFDFKEGGHKRDAAIASGEIARLWADAGDVPGALKLYEEIIDIADQLGDARSRAVTLGDIAHWRAQAGDVSKALKLHEERLVIFEQLGDARERAVTLSHIARLRADAGDVAGAVKLYEEVIVIFEQLGEVRGRAMALGDIASLLAQRGDVAEARRLQNEKLELCRKVGDLDGIATALLGLARLDIGEEKHEGVFPRLEECWSLFNKIGRVHGIAIVGQLFGSLLASAGHPQARDVLQSSKEAFLRLGMTADANEVDEMIQQLPPV